MEVIVLSLWSAQPGRKQDEGWGGGVLGSKKIQKKVNIVLCLDGKGLAETMRVERNIQVEGKIHIHGGDLRKPIPCEKDLPNPTLQFFSSSK